MFVLQNAPMATLELPGLTLNPLSMDSTIAKFDLTLSMEDTDRGLVGWLEYNSDLFDASTITRMLAHFQTLLEGIVAHPEHRLSNLPLLTQQERQQLLVEWNRTGTDYPNDLCIHQLFEAQVERTPDAVAVEFEDQQLTYFELNRRANQLAHYLRSLGVEPDVLVGISLERSSEMILGILAVLKVGGAYVPIDPAYPQERLAYILSNSQVSVLLTQEKLLSGLPESQASLICLDRNWDIISQKSEVNLTSRVKPENLAYVIYTSGSTGKPKGVLVTHQGLCNLASAQIQLFDVKSDSRVLQFASFSFDASIWEIVMALCSGAMLCLGTRESLLLGPTLMQFVRERSITHATLPPSALATLPTEELPALQNMIVAGEACSTELVAQWSKGRKFFNAYGPTESTVCATVYECANDIRKSPIGRPIANTQVYILDPHLQPVPIGVPGEMYITGAGLARGYLNRPELTSEKFIPNPFSNESVARLYRTGDLARYLADGNIEFLGRLDDQVKIRGFRIELGEIEFVLGQHPGVRETAVTIREDVVGSKRLVAYVVVNQTLTPTITELHQFLKDKLPQYMVPSAIVVLEALPLTPNGKVDRRALPAPDTARTELPGTLVAARTPVEKALALIWTEVLGLQQVSIHDNFFALGGDSILTIQIVARANQAGLKLTPKQLFQHQTVAELALVAGTTSALQTEQGLVTGSVLLTPIQQWFFQQEQPQPHHWNQAMFLEVRQPLNPVLLSQVVQQLLVHHDALRLRFVRSTSGWQQVNVEPDSTLSFCTRIDLSVLPELEQIPMMEAAAAQLQASLNLEEGPLVRVALFDLGPNQPNRLLLIVHHLVVDGVSWRILLEDLQTAYQQLSRGQTISLPPKTTSFQDWAQKLSEYARSAPRAGAKLSPEMEQELDYWLAQSWTGVTSLPIDYSVDKDVNTTASAKNVVVALSPEETRALLSEVPQAYNTQINDVLLTALVQAFAQWTDTRCLLVDLEGHGREEILEGVDLSRTVGWFTTVFPVLLDLRKARDPGSALKLVKEQLRRIPNRGIGYGLLRYLKGDVAITEKLQALPQAEVNFNYLGQLDRVLTPDAMFEAAKESTGPEHSLLSKRSHLLEINGIITGSCLHLNWTYSEKVHKRSTVEGLAQSFVAALQKLIAHCQSPEAGGFTPSDFPLAKLNEQKLSKLPTLIDKTDGSSTKIKNVEDIYSLSPMQEGMLFHTLYASNSGVYFEHLNCTLKGNLNVLAFQKAWQQVVERHPVLRTAFIWEGLDEPLQVVRQHISLPWEQHDWRSLSPVEQQEQLEAFLQADRERGFDLSQAPLMRLTLIQLASDAYQFIWSHHHLLLDGWSLPLVLKDVFAFYQAFSLKQDLYHKHSRPYRDYIAWLQQQDLTQAEAFWRHTLKGFTAPTPLGIDRALDSTSSLEEPHSEQLLQLSIAVTSELQSFARQHQLTLNTLIQGAWALLLSRYSSQEDVVFGATFSGRPAALAEVESMVGLFINTLPVRVMVSPTTELLSWLGQLQAQLLELRSYEYSPLVQVQGWSDVPRGLPLFESIVVFENYPVDASLREEGGSLEIRNVGAVEQTNYPLTLAAAPGKQLSLHLSYDCRRFDATTITRMLGHLETLLCGIVTNPEQRLSDLPILTPAERLTLLEEWNCTEVDYPKDLCIHQLFEATVQRTPDAVAIVFEDQILSYCELNRRANQLAHYLRCQGVGPDVLVGICVERSVEMVVGLLGILKAGGAYVPLDPAYPKERLAFMLEDSQVSVLLTQQQLMAALPVHSAQVVQLDGDWEIIAHNSEANPLSPVTSQHLAYVIYTSGSTGQPKGVPVAHQGLVNHSVAVAKQYELQSSDRILQFSSISFDIAVEELFPSWMSGAAVILRSEDMVADSRDFLQAIASLLPERQIEHEQLTVLNLPTAYWHQWVHGLSLLNKPLPQTLRLVVVGGEKASPTTFVAWKQLGGVERIRWLNSYGPTETTVIVTVYEPGANAVTQKLVLELPIGRPIANTQIYLLDTQLQPVPIGVPGELYISGSGLARGYLNRPELTALKFIPNPFSQTLGARLYKTGDLAQYLPNGDIEYLGRLDDQVKIRGFRIELGEIESVLSQHPAVQESVVIAREDVPGNKRLVAYVVVNQTPAPESKQLQQFVKQKLPEYMVPSAIVLLETLPLTPNGKVNRRALPAPDTVIAERQETRIAPRDTLELQLAQIWESVLDVRSIGVTDDFFSLGGHSLLAIRLMAQIQQQFGQNLSLATLFQAPTIEQLARTIHQQTGSLHWSSLVEIQPRGSKTPFFCVPGAGGHALSFYNLAQYLGKDQPFYALQPRGLDGEQAPHTRIEDIAAYYIETLQAVQPQGPYLLGGYSFGGHVAFEMALQLQSSGQEVALLAILDTPAPIPTNQPIAVEKDDARYLTDLAILIEHFSGKSLSVSYDDIQRLQPDEQLNYLLERLKTIDFLPPEATLSQFRGYLQVLKANDRTVYLPQEVYRKRVTFFRTSEQFCDDSTMGWNKISAEQVEIYDVPGDHITMLTEPHVQLLAKQLRTCLERAQAND
ncbi:amino acid adenylation domain-containing protein [Scytonema sp. NUACC21]